MSLCATCGHESPPEFRFCPACGSALSIVPARELRKLVTVVFCDLSGSTALGDRTDPETLRATMRGYYEEMRAILERHGGTVEKFVGDAVMAVFGVPLAHEDDALRAVRAAWEMRGAVARLGLQARIGVNTGEVVAGDGDALVTGDTVNVAARLEQNADTGEVLIGAQTRRLVRDAVQVEPVEVVAKGKSEPLSAFRLVHLDLGAPGVARHLETALVGRMRELALLRQAYERAVGERSCYLFTLLGSAGVGKSRLIEEFLGGVPARVARGRCLGYGDGITLWPVIEVLKQLGAEETIEQLTHATAAASELFWNVRLALEHAAEAAPLVVVFDDVHWAEPAFLDLIDHVADLSRGVPLLLLCAARTELLDARPDWGGGKLNAASALLGPLTEAESAELIGAQAAGIDAVTRERIATAAGGNPFFVEEMLALAREGGDIRAPSTIQALLQARLDLLATGERSVIERGAVEGEIFHRSALERLANGSPVDSHLISLVRKELIRPERSTFPGEDAFRFRHLLIRDAAYEALPKETRAELHERFAEWLEARGGLIELDEILGYHLEQANRYRTELGKPDDGLAARAGRLLAAAGCRAFAREDIAAASSLLERALSLLPSGDDARPAAALALAELVAGRGEFGRHDELVAPLLNWPDRRVRAHARMVDAGTRFTREPEGGSATVRGLLRELVPELEATADIEGLMRAAMLEFWPTVMACDGAAGTAALLRAIAYARQLGDRRTEGIATQYLAPVAGIGSA